MLKGRDILMIHDLHRQGLSIQEIARRTGPVATVEDVAATLAADPVGATPASDHVIAGTAIETVVVVTAFKPVFASVAGEIVLANASFQ